MRILDNKTGLTDTYTKIGFKYRVTVHRQVYSFLGRNIVHYNLAELDDLMDFALGIGYI